MPPSVKVDFYALCPKATVCQCPAPFFSASSKEVVPSANICLTFAKYFVPCATYSVPELHRVLYSFLGYKKPFFFYQNICQGNTLFNPSQLGILVKWSKDYESGVRLSPSQSTSGLIGCQRCKARNHYKILILLISLLCCGLLRMILLSKCG